MRVRDSLLAGASVDQVHDLQERHNSHVLLLLQRLKHSYLHCKQLSCLAHGVAVR